MTYFIDKINNDLISGNLIHGKKNLNNVFSREG